MPSVIKDVLGRNTTESHLRSSSPPRCQTRHNSLVLRITWPDAASQRIHTHPPRPKRKKKKEHFKLKKQISQKKKEKGRKLRIDRRLTWCARQIRSMSCFCKKRDTTSGPKVKETPLSFSDHPVMSLSGSDHNRSQSKPEGKEGHVWMMSQDEGRNENENENGEATCQHPEHRSVSWLSVFAPSIADQDWARRALWKSSRQW